MDSDALIMLGTLLVGGAELRLAVHRVSRRLREHGERIAALEDHRRPPRIPTGETTALQPVQGVESFRRLGVVALVIGALCFFAAGCTQADIDRAQQLADAADAKLAAAAQAEEAAKAAVAEAKQLAEASNSEKAKAAVATAQSALEVADAARVVAATSATSAHQAVDAAKASQAAGQSTFNVLLAAATALVPTAGGLVAAIAQAAKAAQAFRQTVAGVEAAKTKLPPESIATLHAELAKAQDESTKSAVDKVQAAAAAGS